MPRGILHRPEEWASLPHTRQGGRERSTAWYFTGQPCVHGHVCPRRVSNGCCGACHYAREAEYRSTHKEQRNERQRARYAGDQVVRDKDREKIRRYRREHPEYAMLANRLYRWRKKQAANMRNPHRITHTASSGSTD